MKHNFFCLLHCFVLGADFVQDAVARVIDILVDDKFLSVYSSYITRRSQHLGVFTLNLKPLVTWITHVCVHIINI